MKSAVPKPTEYVHVPPPNPDDIRQGYVYTVSFYSICFSNFHLKGPDEIPDPNLPLDQVLGGPQPAPVESDLDPWGIRGPPPPPDVLNNGYQASLIRQTYCKKQRMYFCWPTIFVESHQLRHHLYVFCY